MTRGAGDPLPGPFPLPARSEPVLREDAGRRLPGRSCYLFDVDDELGAGLDLRMRLVARPLVTARVREISAGEFDLIPLLTTLRGGLGLLLIDGIVALDVEVGDRTASELVGAGDLLAPWTKEGDVVLLASETRSRALVTTRIAVLDAEFAERIRPWPQILHALLRRSVRRAMRLDVQRAATCHPRADVRIALLLWHLAERWGIVELDGILVPLPLTHRLIGQLVGAERPSVSHALGRLSSAGLVTRKPSGMVLHGTPEHHTACLIERSRPRQRARMSGVEFSPRQAGDRAAHRARHLDDQRPRLRRRHGRDDRGDAAVARGPAQPDAAGDARRRALQPDARGRVRRGLHARLVRRRGRPAGPVHPGARGLGPERGDQRRRALGGARRRSADRAADHHERVARPARPAGRDRARARDVRDATAGSPRCATTRPGRWACATTSATAGGRAPGCRS